MQVSHWSLLINLHLLSKQLLTIPVTLWLLERLAQSHCFAASRSFLGFQNFGTLLDEFCMKVLIVQNLCKCIHSCWVRCLALFQDILLHLSILPLFLQLLQGNKLLDLKTVLRVLQQVLLSLEECEHFLVVALRALVAQLTIVHLQFKFKLIFASQLCNRDLIQIIESNLNSSSFLI